MILAFQVLRVLQGNVVWMGLQDWPGREVTQVSQDLLEHQEKGVSKDL